MICPDRARDGLEHHGLPGARRRDDQPALPHPKRRDQVHGACADRRLILRFEENAAVRKERRQLIEIHGETCHSPRGIPSISRISPATSPRSRSLGSRRLQWSFKPVASPSRWTNSRGTKTSSGTGLRPKAGHRRVPWSPAISKSPSALDDGAEPEVVASQVEHEMVARGVRPDTQAAGFKARSQLPQAKALQLVQGEFLSGKSPWRQTQRCRS